MIQTALVGCAHIHTPNYVNKLSTREDVQVKSVWDHDAERARKNAESLGAQVVVDTDVVWSDSEIDAVIICSETNRHHDLIIPAAQAGKHMFVEKPLGIHADESLAMAEAVTQAGVIFQTGYFMRGNPVNQFLKSELAKGSFGQVSHMHVSNAHSGALRGMFDDEWRWMADPTQAGVGGFGDLGSHALDLMLWLLGDQGVVRGATASLSAGTSRYEGCDEHGEGTLEFESGVIGTLSAGWVDLTNPFQLLISGTKAHAHVTNGQLYYRTDSSSGAEPMTELPEALPHAFDLFLDAITGVENLPLVTVQEAAVRSSVMAALYEGARSHKWMTPAG